MSALPPNDRFTDADGVPRRALALTVHQPWATLLARGVQRVVNRDWTPPPEELAVGDFVLVHAGRTFDPEAWESALSLADAEGVAVGALEALRRPLATARGIASRALRAEAMRAAEARARGALPFGAVVGVVRYAGALDPCDVAAARGWYVGPQGWAVDLAVEIEAVEALGAPGLFLPGPEAFERVRARWHEAAFG